MAAILFTAFGVCSLVPYIFFRCKKKLMPGIILKIITSAFFLLTTSAAALAVPDSLFGQYKFLIFGIVIGQIFGMMGDFWLDMKDMYAQHHDVYVFAGFISFFIGHCFFIAGLLKTYNIMEWQNLLIMLGTGTALCALVIAAEKPMKVKYGKFKGITAAYCFIFGMSIAAALCAYLFGGKNPQALVMTIGLVVFLASDLFLSGTFFGQGKDKTFDYTANYVCYYGGQFTIALSLLALQACA